MNATPRTPHVTSRVVIRDAALRAVSEWSRANARFVPDAARAYRRAMAATAALRDMGDDADDDRAV